MTTKLDIALDDNHDFYMDDTGDIAVATDIDALETDIEVVLHADRGEWAFDVTWGTPWLTEILNQKAPDIPRVTATLKGVVGSLPEVNRIIQWDPTYDPQARRLTITGALDTIYGPLPITYSIP